MSVEELLALARKLQHHPRGPVEWTIADKNDAVSGFARAVIELLETLEPDPDMWCATGHPTQGRVVEVYASADSLTPAEARGLAVALLKAADESEAKR